MEQLSIREVKTKQELNDFVRFPHTLYAEHPYWVPALRMDDKATFNIAQNPSARNCEARLWIAYKNGRAVGRIAGIINHTYIAKWKHRYGRFGWLDFINDAEVLKALLGTVEDWAKERGMSGLQGPLGFNDFDPEGMLVDGFDEAGTMQTIYNFPYYARYIESLGYSKDADWLEFEIHIPAHMPARILRMAPEVEKRNELHSLKLTHSKELLKYSDGVFELLNAAYKDLYGVVALSPEQIAAIVKQYFPFLQPGFVSLVLDKNKEVAAFAIAMPSFTKALQRCRGKLFPTGIFHLYRALKKNDLADLYIAAIRPGLQGKGVNAMLIRDLAGSFIQKKIKKAITHPVLENNTRMLTLWKDFETRQTKRRRCYIKLLDETDRA